MLGSNPYMKGQLDPFSRLSTAHECERYTDRQTDNLVAKGPLRVLRTLHSSMRTVYPTTTCERLRHICINPERFTVHPATAWWNLPSNSTRLGADRLHFTMGNPIPRWLAPSQGGILTPIRRNVLWPTRVPVHYDYTTLLDWLQQSLRDSREHKTDSDRAALLLTVADPGGIPGTRAPLFSEWKFLKKYLSLANNEDGPTAPVRCMSLRRAGARWLQTTSCH